MTGPGGSPPAAGEFRPLNRVVHTSISWLRRRCVGSFDTYQEARSLVDQLAEQGISTDSVSIKLEVVRSAENLPGELGRGRAFGEGGATGR
jgi:hypothetical protein